MRVSGRVCRAVRGACCNYFIFWPIVSGPSARARRLVRFGTANENCAKSAVCGLAMMTMIIHGLRVPSGVCGCLLVFSHGSCGIL